MIQTSVVVCPEHAYRYLLYVKSCMSEFQVLSIPTQVTRAACALGKVCILRRHAATQVSLDRLYVV